jgi:hypothetical protein
VLGLSLLFFLDFETLSKGWSVLLSVAYFGILFAGTMFIDKQCLDSIDPAAAEQAKPVIIGASLIVIGILCFIGEYLVGKSNLFIYFSFVLISIGMYEIIKK